jgi:hypothetical protein
MLAFTDGSLARLAIAATRMRRMKRAAGCGHEHDESAQNFSMILTKRPFRPM